MAERIVSCGVFRGVDRDLILITPHSYLVLKCNESLAHQLLFAPDAIAYKLQHSGHFIPVSLLGTLILMISVIALANAKIQLQIACAASYVILNIGHWMAAALPRCTYISLLVPLLLAFSMIVFDNKFTDSTSLVFRLLRI